MTRSDTVIVMERHSSRTYMKAAVIIFQSLTQLFTSQTPKMPVISESCLGFGRKYRAYAENSYTTFNRGNDTGSFMLNPDGSIYIGEVWPGYTVFPDWFGGAGPWWINEMTTWHSKVAFDGAWIDMNEVSSFCVGSCGSQNITMNPVHPGFSLPGEPGSVNTLDILQMMIPW